ncbi:MAG TPA: MBL fold metallo-hydrolase [Candidatus Dojkabacteria bacterium]|nr:MBL fold metallo-hydrolase [Candidatus Dojkabacteria bacterium]
MKIRYQGEMSVRIDCDGTVFVTDPQSLQVTGRKAPKVEADVVLVSDTKYLGVSDYATQANLTLESSNREKVFEIVNFGEYEIGGIMIRRSQRNGFYILDQGYVRIVYAGYISPNFEVDKAKNLGDVDVLILPVGDGGIFPSNPKLSKIIQIIDPSYLIPIAFSGEGMQDVDTFIKECDLTKGEDMKELKLTDAPEKDEKTLKVIVLPEK